MNSDEHMLFHSQTVWESFSTTHWTDDLGKTDPIPLRTSFSSNKIEILVPVFLISCSDQCDFQPAQTIGGMKQKGQPWASAVRVSFKDIGQEVSWHPHLCPVGRALFSALTSAMKFFELKALEQNTHTCLIPTQTYTPLIEQEKTCSISRRTTCSVSHMDREKSYSVISVYIERANFY